MDWEAFVTDVWENVNESLYADQWTADDNSGLAFTIGETWQGALYGAEENADGQKAVHLFQTEADQLAWFEGVTADLGSTASSFCAAEHSPKVFYPGSETEVACSCGWKGEDGKTLREHLEGA